jgi:hypothetical protein
MMDVPRQSPSGEPRPVGQAAAEPGVRPLPPHPFLAIVTTTPAAILHGRLHYLTEQATNDLYLQVESGRGRRRPATDH